MPYLLGLVDAGEAPATASFEVLSEQTLLPDAGRMAARQAGDAYKVAVPKWRPWPVRGLRLGVSGAQ